MDSRRFTATILLSFFALASCVNPPSKRGQTRRERSEGTEGTAALAPDTTASAQESTEYKEISSLYSDGNHELALKKLNGFEKNHPKSPLIPQARNLHGLILLLAKKPVPAIHQFKLAIKGNPSNSIFSQYVNYNLAKAFFESEQLDQAEQTIDQIQIPSLDKDNQIKVHYLKARLFKKRSLPIESAKESLLACRLLSDFQLQELRSTHGSVVDLFEQSVQEIQSIPALEALYREFEGLPLSDVILFQLGAREIAGGNRGKGEFLLRDLMVKFPRSAYYAQASNLIRAQEDQAVVDGSAIGVLLPMKGKFSKFGAKALQGIELALGIFNEKEPESKLTLVLEDSGDEPEQTSRALGRLVSNHHVIAVIGPLLSKGIDLVTLRAQELGVPLISLARHAGIAGNSVFQAGLTLELQAYQIARYAIEKLKLRRYAILFPNDKVGVEISQQFWDAIENLGGQIVGFESYGNGETDFLQAVDKLSGRYYKEARIRELEALAKDREANHIKKKTWKTEQYYNLKPIVDFEAVFIPDEPKVAGQILPTFAYRDVDKIRFLGTSAWNTPEFPSRAQNYAEFTLFPDAFILPADSTPENDPNLTHAFVEKYRAMFAQDPTTVEALAYDAAKILENAVSKLAGKRTRAELANQLKATRGFQGLTGKISYSDGHLNRDLKILTVKNGHILEARQVH